MPREPRTKQTARKSTGGGSSAKAPRAKSTSKKAAADPQMVSFTVPLPSLLQAAFPEGFPGSTPSAPAPRKKQTAKKSTGGSAPRATKSKKEEGPSTSSAVAPAAPKPKPSKAAPKKAAPKKGTTATSQQSASSSTSNNITMSFNISMQMQDNSTSSSTTTTTARTRAPRTKQTAKKTPRATKPKPSQPADGSMIPHGYDEIEDIEMGEPY